jgi:dienelactone hydrolase
MRAMREPSREQPFLPDSGRGPGVLVLVDATGGDALARDAGIRLAHHGFAAWAPLLPVPAAVAPDEAERAAVDAGIERLFCEHGVDGARVGVLGFGRGGLLALDAAARGARIAAVVAFDAELEAAALDASLARVDAFVLAVFAEKAACVARGDVAELERRLRGEQIACDLRTQTGVAEGFADPGRPDRYDAIAARSAWDAALARLRAEL